jgi:hypothetical protein
MFPQFGDEIFYYERNMEELSITYSIDNLNRWLVLAPNWEGIIPGETHYITAAEIISKNKMFYQVIIYPPVSDAIKNYQLSFRWIERRTSSEIIPLFGDALFDRESGINTCVRIPIQPIQLSELFLIIGEPSHIIKYPVNIHGDSRWHIEILYMKKGMLLETSLEKSKKINEAIFVYNVVFFTPTEEGLDNAMNEGYHLQLQPWKGYSS